jgi:S1-C subfamily serine protease
MMTAPPAASTMVSSPTLAMPPMFNVTGVAGAQLVAITEGLARTLHVSRGVLVTSAPVGSPAFDSGLRDGDVILKAAGMSVRTVGEVRDVVAQAASNGEHAVTVECRRDQRTRKLLLRWDR